jgi:predicted small secreted protein
MKKTFLLLASSFILSLIVLSGCNFSVGTNKDLKTGLSTTYNGFRVKEVFLGNMDKQHLSSNKIPLNSTFLIIATDVENYTLKDGKAYPGCEITVKDKAGKVLGHIDDAMADVSRNGLEPEMATTLSARATLSPPFEKGKTYNVAVRFFDKQNEKNKINADIDIVLQ